MKNIFLWDVIRKENINFFEMNPLCELVVSQMSDRKNSHCKEIFLKNFIKFWFYSIAGFFPKKSYLADGKDGIFSIRLDRSNDWGLLWPVVLEADKHNLKCYLFLSEVCYNNHSDEIAELKNIFPVVTKKGFWKKIGKRELHDILDAIKYYKLSKDILRKYGIGQKWDFLSIYISNVYYARGLYESFFVDSKFSVSLGDRLFGYIYNLYGIKHFGMQHGDTRPESMGVWTTLAKANVYAALTYGDYYSKLYQEHFGTNCVTAGNVVFSKENRLFRKENKKIIFFSSSQDAIEEGNLINEAGISCLNDTLDQIIRLYRDLPKTYSISIKLHPNENDKYIKNYNSIFGNEIEVIDGTVPSKEILKTAIIAISWYSTVNIEAIKMGCVAMQLMGEISKGYEQEYSLKIKDLKEVIKLLHNKKQLNEVFLWEQKMASRFIKVSDNVEDFIINQICNICNIDYI